MPLLILSAVEAVTGDIPLNGGPITIGRHPENRIAIEDSLLSRYHAVLEAAEGGDWMLKDLGSRNGTRVNGVRVEEVVLHPGDEVKIGKQRYLVASEETLKDRQAAARDADPASEAWLSDLKQLIEMLPPKDVREHFLLIDGRGRPSRALQSEGDGPRAMALLLMGASKSRATDIHLEPKGEAVNVRMRVDGQMVQVTDLPNRVGELTFGLVRTACQFRQTARDQVLDGHFSCRVKAKDAGGGEGGAAGGVGGVGGVGGGAGVMRQVDYRISFTPSVHGPKLVLRVLDPRDAPKSIREMGLPPYMEERIRRFCAQDSGLLLVCGPTGSGKTTTLYNAIREIDRAKKNVVTIEDPVEYQLEGVTQIPIDENKGNTFGQLLRSVLRQDPDVILVGEIRDEETAKTAMQASMTGHLVFSTVHAKDTISSVFRLLDLKVEPYLVANSIEVIVAQRLVRVLCEVCKRDVPVSPGQATRMGRFLENQTKVYVATGCAACLRTGYRGRKAIFEVLDFTDELRDVVMTDPTIAAMRRVIETGLFTTLTQSGWQVAARGVTSMEEVDRVASSR